MIKRSKQKRVMTLILTAMIIIGGLTSFPAQAKGSSGKDIDECKSINQVSDIDEYGEDTEENELVLVIRDEVDWNNFATVCGPDNNYYKGITVKLANNIAFDGISNNNYYRVEKFKGTFDGCGHFISGLVATSDAGLFGNLEEMGIVKNLTLTDSTLSDDRSMWVGGIAEMAKGTIYNCHIKNTRVSAARPNEKVYAGGIAGYGYYYSVIKNCTVDVDSKVDSTYYAGGICGWGRDRTEIDNCANMAQVTAEYAAGIANKVYNVNNSYNVGKLIGSEGTAGITFELKGVAWDCYYSDESADVAVTSADTTSNRYDQLTLSEMQQQTFCDTLNNNRGTNTDWLEWEKTTDCVYPTLKEVKNIKACNIALASDKVEYTGEEQIPTMSVTDGTVSLKLNEDYTVTCTNNKDVGTATVLIEGIGRYCDSVEKTFSIIKATPKYTYSNIGIKTYGDPSVNLHVQAANSELGTITYRSSNSKVASVSNTGTVSFNAPGTATITVSCSGTSNYEAIKFDIPVVVVSKGTTVDQSDNNIVSSGKSQSIIIINSKITKDKGASFKLKPTIYGNGKVTYKSSNKKVATVNSKGSVKCKKYGKATITIKVAQTSNYKGTSKKVKLVVSRNAPPAKVKIGKWKYIGKNFNGGNGYVYRIKWKKVKGADGYQVCSRDILYNSETYTFYRNQKRCVYEEQFSSDVILLRVKVRAYKIVKGKKIYGPWSEEKTERVFYD